MRQGFGSKAPLASRGPRLLRRFALAASLAALSLAASGSPAGAASVTIGQLAAVPAPPCTIAPVERAQPTVTSGNPYVVPATGGVTSWVLTSWSHAAGTSTGQTLTMKIYRKVADPATFQVVGHDGPRPLVGGTINTFQASVPVRSGDVLGFHQPTATPTACRLTAPGDTFQFFHPGTLNDGESAPFAPSAENNRLNISAVVGPTNTFSVGAIKRNKKKGTATLTATVPNPGELTGSGKGVKVAIAARISKMVTAPGKVKLTITAKGKKKATLNDAGKVTVKPKITYTPTGGDPSTQSVKLKLKKNI
jgi:hypothetical protein